MITSGSYQTCLSDIEAVLPRLAGIIGASFQPGGFTAAEALFEESGDERSEWNLSGQTGVSVTVKLEKHEGYLFVTVAGAGAAFQKAKQYLWDCYLAQGGSPEAQEKP